MQLFLADFSILIDLITTGLLTIINVKGRGQGVVYFGIVSNDSNFSFDTSTIPFGIEESNTPDSESPISIDWIQPKLSTQHKYMYMYQKKL